jgi:L-iditol 2-dehydrogenase
LKLPTKVDFEKATLIEPIGCCLRAIKKGNVKAGDTVAIIGAGATGIIHTALSRIFGASKIIVSDLFDYRLGMAKKFGADVTINPEREVVSEVVSAETNGRGVDLAIVTAPSLEAYRSGLSICRKGGRLLVFAPTVPGKYLDVSPKGLLFSEIQIVPSYSTSHLETREALELIQSGRIDAEGLITHRFRLKETAAAFKTALESKDSLKIIILNGD